MHWPLYILGKGHQYPLSKRLCGPQSGCGHGEEGNLASVGSQPLVHETHNVTTVAELSPLMYQIRVNQIGT